MTGPIRYTPLYYWIESQAATIASLRQQLQERERLLAESQAREKKRVELMDKQYWMDAQSIPQDSTALDEALAKAKLEGKREAILEVADWLSVEHGRTHEPIELRKMAEGQP